MKFWFLIFLVGLLSFPDLVSAQKGLEGIIIETYYISDENDATDIFSGKSLKPGSVTYRIFADLAPEYKLQVVYGMEGHPWKIETTTSFFNSKRGGFGMGGFISDAKIRENTVPIDSWITIGHTAQHYFGVLKKNDPDGSIIGGENNDGGSAMIESGLLINKDERMGIPIVEADGYVPRDKTDIRLFNLTLDEFKYVENDGKYVVNDGAITVVEGVMGETDENHVLIAQVTTDGELSFEFNIQLIAPYGGPENFVARNPDGTQFTHPDLIFPREKNTTE